MCELLVQCIEIKVDPNFVDLKKMTKIFAHMY